MKKQYGKGLKGYLDNWDSVFKKQKKKPHVKKEICPHCATKNLIRMDEFTVKCKKCDYER
jgi:ribosomal protein L37AE/L43A